ncbi:hypothetical protein MMC26_003714 [Xylographa opegraphella]|nr:hypothetical protein [Xylographa opegraphella]
MTALLPAKRVIQIRPNIVLGPYQIDKDTTRLVSYLNDRTVTGNFGVIMPDVYTTDDALQFLKRNNYKLHYSIRNLEQDDDLIGDIAIYSDGRFGYWLSPEYWNKGIMTHAVDGLIREAKLIGIDKITAEVYTSNPASRLVLIRNGFDSLGEGQDNPKGLLAWKFELDLSRVS